MSNKSFKVNSKAYRYMITKDKALFQLFVIRIKIATGVME
jgi:hypothetical protein